LKKFHQGIGHGHYSMDFLLVSTSSVYKQGLQQAI
jgi:hypothetical protein